MMVFSFIRIVSQYIVFVTKKNKRLLGVNSSNSQITSKGKLPQTSALIELIRSDAKGLLCFPVVSKIRGET